MSLAICFSCILSIGPNDIELNIILKCSYDEINNIKESFAFSQYIDPKENLIFNKDFLNNTNISNIQDCDWRYDDDFEEVLHADKSTILKAYFDYKYGYIYLYICTT